MEIDKRPSYIWIVVILINTFVFLYLLIPYLFDYGFSGLLDLGLGDFMLPGIVLIFSIIPVLISKSNNKWKDNLGYGIPVFILLPIFYLIEASKSTKGGMWAQIGFIGLSIYLVIAAVIFALFYAMAKYAQKWNVKFVLSLIWIEIIIFVSSLYFTLFY